MRVILIGNIEAQWSRDEGCERQVLHILNELRYRETANSGKVCEVQNVKGTEKENLIMIMICFL